MIASITLPIYPFPLSYRIASRGSTLLPPSQIMCHMQHFAQGLVRTPPRNPSYPVCILLPKMAGLQKSEIHCPVVCPVVCLHQFGFLSVFRPLCRPSIPTLRIWASPLYHHQPLLCTLVSPLSTLLVIHQLQLCPDMPQFMNVYVLSILGLIRSQVENGLLKLDFTI